MSRIAAKEDAMPWAKSADGTLVICFGQGDLMATTGYWNDQPQMVGMSISEMPEQFEPGHPPTPPKGTSEGDLGEQAIVRFAFSETLAVDTLIAALEDVREALIELPP